MFGGTTYIKGLLPRCVQELKRLSKTESKIRMFALKERKFPCWVGSTVLSSISSLTDFWITKKDVEEGDMKTYDLKGLC